MSNLVLVHGAFHGSWCWDPIVSRLQELGHNATAVDLPGRTGKSSANSLEDYVAAVIDVVRSRAPAVLVGHSLAGVTIGQVAEEIPDCLSALTYVCAYLVENGRTVDDLVRSDADSLLLDCVDVDELAGLVKLKAGGPLKESFYGACAASDYEFARNNLCAEPLAPAVTRAAISPGGHGRVPRYYVECLQDRVISIGLQRRMLKVMPCRQVFTLDTDHSPFFSAPDELTSILQRVVADAG